MTVTPTTPIRRALFVIVACAAIAPASAEERPPYRLQEGDTLEFAVAGAPELSATSTISIDGSIVLPLAGEVPAARETLAAFARGLQDLMAGKVYRRRGQDGSEQPTTVAPDEIILRIAEYKPVYVNGDISKPGEVKFRPSLTVRQAVALAGGFDIMHFRMNNPFLEQADLRADYERLWIELARQMP